MLTIQKRYHQVNHRSDWQDPEDGRATTMQDVPQPKCYVCNMALLDARSLHLGAHRVPAGTSGYDCWTKAQETIS